MTNTTKYNNVQSETERIRALKKYDILDTPPDGSFDHITKLASLFLKVPIAIVSLVDTDRIWFKSHFGLDVQQIDREEGLCASAILSDDLYMVENAITDPRTLSNSLVAGEFGLRFYAAVPIKVREGYNLGTLCIIDKKPRSISEEEKEILSKLAEIIVDQLELRLEARKANEKQNQMLGMVAHELKNPLSTIPLYAGLLKEKIKGKDDLENMCNHIEKASKRMQTLIHEVLETARLQAHEIHLKKNYFDIAVVIARVTAINLVLATAKKQKLYLDITDNVMVHADENKMAEVFDNLINNAIKYSPAGSEISIKLKPGQQKAIFEVIDQGPGFTEVDKERLFMPFTRLSARPTGGENSTGIGLSIVKMLVDAHGGTINADNNIEKAGAHFIVEIPAIPVNVRVNIPEHN
jgi:signal transduction histidine kinase